MDESPLQTACDAVAGVPLDVVIRALHHSHKVRLKALSVIEGSRDATLVRPFEASPSAVFSISAIQTQASDLHSKIQIHNNIGANKKDSEGE